MSRLWWAPLGALLVAGCPASHLRPTGPPPVYEKPVLPAWEAAAPVDPFASVGEGAWVDETGDDASAGEAGRPDAGAVPGDAALSKPAEAGADAGNLVSDAEASRPSGR